MGELATNTAAHGRIRLRFGAVYALLLSAELLAIAALVQSGRLELSWPISGAAAALSLGGLVPALVRPSRATTLIASLFLLLASNLLSLGERPVGGLLWLAFGNVAATVLLTLHTLAPPRRLHLASVLVSGLLIGLTYGPTPPTFGAGASALLSLWIAGLVVCAAARIVGPTRSVGETLRSPGAARTVALSLLVAAVPVVLRSLGAFVGVTLPVGLVLAAALIPPLGVLVAVLRNDLFAIDAVLRRALLYSWLSVGLLAGSFGLAVAVATLLASLMPSAQLIAAGIGVLAVAVLGEPLRRWLQHTIDACFFPERQRFRHALADAQASLAHILSYDEVVQLLAVRLPSALGAAALLDLADEARQGSSSGMGWRAELRVGTTQLGTYWLGPRPKLPEYDAEERAALEMVLSQASLALAYTQASADLRRLNDELEEQVTARTAQALAQQQALVSLAERRRLARDLHDSVTQTIFSLGISTRAIRDLVTSAPAAAIEALQMQETLAQRAGDELRGLLSQLRDTSTDESDLVAYIVGHCAQLRAAHGLEVSLDAPPSLHLPMVLVETTLALVREGLHNVLKHSGVQQARLELHEEGSAVTLRVTDTGRGFDPQLAHGGYGLWGMAERVSAVGGRFRLDARPGGGVQVTVRIPKRNV